MPPFPYLQKKLWEDSDALKPIGPYLVYKDYVFAKKAQNHHCNIQKRTQPDFCSSQWGVDKGNRRNVIPSQSVAQAVVYPRRSIQATIEPQWKLWSGDGKETLPPLL